MYDKGRTYYWKHILFPVIQDFDRVETPFKQSVSGSKSTFSVAKLLKDNTINEVKDAFEKSF